MTHSLLDFRNPSATGRVTLVTLGSPLRKMSRILKSRIYTPQQLIARYVAASMPKRWFNFWRTSDVIGKSLFEEAHSLTVESCLGFGGHRNYWSDPRLWREMSKLLTDRPKNLG